LDILVHDVQNYNQIARLSADILSEFEVHNPEFQSVVKRLTAAIEGSSQLLERARKLGNAISEKNPKLFPVSLVTVVTKSLNLIKHASPSRDIVVDEATNYPSQAFVIADDLLDEVFTNIFSNSVIYTETASVQLGIAIEDMGETWKVSVSDQGNGIKDEIKSKIFDRYQKGAKGSGLGLSIIHSLVVDRYNGEVKLRDRVEGDHSKGTIVEVFLPKSM
jgi:signal transduction histidine kinase